MDRITQSLLKEFSEQNNLNSLKQFKQFENFCTYITVKRHYSESFDTTELVFGGGGDEGIDAIAIIVNGVLINDIDTYSDIARSANHLDVQFIFVQSDMGSSFEGKKILNFIYGVQSFFESAPKDLNNEEIRERCEIMEAIFSESSKFKRENPTCRLYYATTGKWMNDPNLLKRIERGNEVLGDLNLFGSISITPIGIDEIRKFYSHTQNAIEKTFIFENKATLPQIDQVPQSYLGYISAKDFVSIIQDDDGEIIRSIFYDNVRDWQQWNPVNSDIKETINSHKGQNFVLMNNGITIICRTLKVTANKFHIEDFQIVNGCQTSHVLYDLRDTLNENVYVPLRLINTDNENIIELIIKATNNQTEIKKEEFYAVMDFAKKLEEFFNTFTDDKRLYYERRSRQYDKLNIEKTRIITPKNMIRSYAAMFLEEPHNTTRSYAALSDRVGTEIFVENHKLYRSA